MKLIIVQLSVRCCFPRKNAIRGCNNIVSYSVSGQTNNPDMFVVEMEFGARTYMDAVELAHWIVDGLRKGERFHRVVEFDDTIVHVMEPGTADTTGFFYVRRVTVEIPNSVWKSLL